MGKEKGKRLRWKFLKKWPRHSGRRGGASMLQVRSQHALVGLVSVRSDFVKASQPAVVGRHAHNGGRGSRRPTKTFAKHDREPLYHEDFVQDIAAQSARSAFQWILSRAGPSAVLPSCGSGRADFAGERVSRGFGGGQGKGVQIVTCRIRKSEAEGGRDMTPSCRTLHAPSHIRVSIFGIQFDLLSHF